MKYTITKEIDEKLDNIIETASKKYNDTGKSRDEMIAAACDAYFDRSIILDLTDDEIKKHLARLFESTPGDYNDLEKWGLAEPQLTAEVEK